MNQDAWATILLCTRRQQQLTLASNCFSYSTTRTRDYSQCLLSLDITRATNESDYTSGENHWPYTNKRLGIRGEYEWYTSPWCWKMQARLMSRFTLYNPTHVDHARRWGGRRANIPRRSHTYSGITYWKHATKYVTQAAMWATLIEQMRYLGRYTRHQASRTILDLPLRREIWREISY